MADLDDAPPAPNHGEGLCERVVALGAVLMVAADTFEDDIGTDVVGRLEDRLDGVRLGGVDGCHSTIAGVVELL